MVKKTTAPSEAPMESENESVSPAVTAVRMAAQTGLDHKPISLSIT